MYSAVSLFNSVGLEFDETVGRDGADDGKKMNIIANINIVNRKGIIYIQDISNLNEQTSNIYIKQSELFFVYRLPISKDTENGLIRAYTCIIPEKK